jgi:hypothetical protein
MSLQTDRVFIYALNNNSELTELLGAKEAQGQKPAVKPRIFTTAIPRSYYPNVDAFVEPVDNCPLPYLIVTFDGLTNDSETKDDTYDGGEDRVQISVEIAAEAREDVAEIAELVRSTMNDFVHDYEPPQSETEEDLSPLIPSGWNFSAQAVQYDMNKPCYWQALVYACDTNV